MSRGGGDGLLSLLSLPPDDRVVSVPQCLGRGEEGPPQRGGPPPSSPPRRKHATQQRNQEESHDEEPPPPLPDQTEGKGVVRWKTKCFKLPASPTTLRPLA